MLLNEHSVFTIINYVIIVVNKTDLIVNFNHKTQGT